MSHPQMDSPPDDNSSEAPARPKFSRRPAHFSRAAASAPPEVPIPIAEPIHAPAKTPKPTGKKPLPWQEDTRFGVAMLLIVLVVNLLLVVGLAHLRDAPAEGSMATEVAAKAPTMPVAVGSRSNGVTLFAQPDAERLTIQQLDLRKQDSNLSTSPSDIPAPTARALDTDEE